MNPNRRVPGSPEEWMDFAESDMRLARLAAGDTSIRREQVASMPNRRRKRRSRPCSSPRTLGFR